MYLLAYIPVLEQLSAPEREREREEKGGRGGRRGEREGVERERERPFEAKAQYRQSAPPARLASPASTSTLAFHLLPLPPQPLHSPPGFGRHSFGRSNSLRANMSELASTNSDSSSQTTAADNKEKATAAKPQEQEEEVDIDLEAPETEKAALAIQNQFRRFQKKKKQ
ncbi:hypothetical protein D4764_03G0005040 [Takifugu flavidus]|uniref:Purkinje cell protein 4 n=1 Tax=Takifugu flavidus TaxID=433684 RepID=A0A5C6N808_9TELE|nr:hypothetical protein D4764_03G0005040 [Takifugu flavidus]